MIGTQRVEIFLKILLSSGCPRGRKFQKYDVYDKNYCFPAPIFKRQLLDCSACAIGKSSLN